MNLLQSFSIALLLCFLLGEPLLAQNSKPNIVFVMADDLGYGDLSCYGSKTVKTPHLDRLASSGVRCTDFHSNGAVCSPTRAALMTGRYQQRCGVDGVITAARHRDKGIPLSEWTVAEALKDLGYETALFGKWHLGYPAKFNPIHQGFDRFNGFVSGNVDYHAHIDQEGYFDWWIQDKIKDEPGYITDLITDHAVNFIKQKRESPFLLMLHHGAPHYPIQNRETPGFRVTGKKNKNQPKPKLENPANVYRDMIEIMDEGIGKVIAALEEAGVRKNTLIVFCSDNGPARLGSAGKFRGKKGTIWEGGHRVCGIFNMPGNLPSGSRCDSTIMTMDMLPTFVALADGTIAESRNLDGINILPALQGKSIKRDPLFWKHGNSIAVRDGSWKLVQQKQKTHLFDLSTDPGETKNLAESNPQKVRRMVQLIEDWKKSYQSR